MLVSSVSTLVAAPLPILSAPLAFHLPIPSRIVPPSSLLRSPDLRSAESACGGTRLTMHSLMARMSKCVIIISRNISLLLSDLVPRGFGVLGFWGFGVAAKKENEVKNLLL